MRVRSADLYALFCKRLRSPISTRFFDDLLLATEPDFIMLDEPFAGVDPISVIDIKEIINHLRDRGIGVLITDHNVRDTLDICEKAYIVGEGYIIASGTPEDVLNNEHVRKVYLGEQFRM